MPPAEKPGASISPRTNGVGSQLLADWRKRLVELRESLAATAEHESAWLWAIKYEILAYLLHRYAGDVVPALVWPRSVPAEPVVVRGPAADPPQRQVSVPAGMGKAPRSGEAIRGKLAAISSQNQERYVEHERKVAAAKAKADQDHLVNRMLWLLGLLRELDTLSLSAPPPDSPDEETTVEAFDAGRLQARRQLKETIRQELDKLGFGPARDMQSLCEMLAQVVDEEEPNA